VRGAAAIRLCQVNGKCFLSVHETGSDLESDRPRFFLLDAETPSCMRDRCGCRNLLFYREGC
jgi:hypothetical protein